MNGEFYFIEYIKKKKRAGGIDVIFVAFSVSLMNFFVCFNIQMIFATQTFATVSHSGVTSASFV